MRTAVTEAEILRACIGLLKLRGVVYFRMNSGVLPNPRGRPVRAWES